jgi:hypothetical protein
MSLNHDKQALYVHNLKCGGRYVCSVLARFYKFHVDGTMYQYQEETDAQFFTPQPLYQEKRYVNSIQRQGIYRFWLRRYGRFMMDNYFKFTFVRNPYTRFYSAFAHLRQSRHVDSDPYWNSDAYMQACYTSFNQFSKSQRELSGRDACHAFITQFDHLCDDDGTLQFNFIGRLEQLDDDLITVLHHLGLAPEFYLFSKQTLKTSSSTSFVEAYDQEVLDFVNIHFEKDFVAFSYPRLKTIDEFRSHFFGLNNMTSYNIARLPVRVRDLDTVSVHYETLIEQLVAGLRDNEQFKLLQNELSTQMAVWKTKRETDVVDIQHTLRDYVSQKRRCDGGTCTKCGHQAINLLAYYTHREQCVA